MIRNSQKNSTIPIIPGVSLDLNPFASETLSARRMTNWTVERGRLIRYPGDFAIWSNSMGGWSQSGGSGIANDDAVVRFHDFRYTRNSAPENKRILWTTGGQAYNYRSGTTQPIFPGTASFNALTKKPYAGQLGNRLFFSDGVASYVYDGRDPCQTWGLARSTTAPTVTAQNIAGSIVAATGVKGCFTWVVLDEASNRVHESSRSNISNFLVIGGADDAVRLDITGITPPARATHWSAYISELDGSNIYRRAATTAIATLTVDISAFPAATSPKAPVRNDPPPPTTIGCVAKNRHFIRDDANPQRFYFSALGEVEGTLNGSGPESFPGYSSNSVSDLVNSDTVPDREIRALIEYEDIVFIFTESKGYALTGQMNLLDSRSPRDLVKRQVFNEGCLGPDAICATPYGLVWMSPSKKIWLWDGGEEVFDLGLPIQPILSLVVGGNYFVSTYPDIKSSVHMSWWSGNNRKWLMVSLSTPGTDDFYSTYGNYIFDFSLVTEKHPGIWYFLNTNTNYWCSGVYQDDDGFTFLYAGGDNGLYQLDTYASPTHLNLSFILGQTYLGSTVATAVDSYLYTNILSPNGDLWCTGHYLSLVHGTQDTAASGSTTAPTVAMLVDVETVDGLGNTPGFNLTLDSILTSGEKRAWLRPESAGSSGGAFGKNFAFFLYYTGVTDTDTTTDASARPLALYNAIHRLSASWSPQKDLSR